VNPDPENLLDALKSISEMISEIPGVANQQPITESVTDKSKRGRPKKYDKIALAGIAFLSSAKSVRGKQNALNAYKVEKFLSQDKNRFAYVLTKKTILAEIGRFNHPSMMVSVASEICTTRMKTAKAIGLCRRMRGKGSPDAKSLAKKIRRAIQDYRDRHPNLSEADLSTALRMASYG